MSVRAKFNCTSKTPEGDETIQRVTFEAVYGDGKDNAEWSKWTPSGHLSMQITNEAAHAQFEVGKAYYIDINPA